MNLFLLLFIVLLHCYLSRSHIFKHSKLGEGEKTKLGGILDKFRSSKFPKGTNYHNYQGNRRNLKSFSKPTNQRVKRQNDVGTPTGHPYHFDELVSSINRSLDPCDDFHQFVCDGWMKKHPIPRDNFKYDQLYMVNDRLDNDIKNILTHPNRSLGRDFQMMYTFYDKCIEDQENPNGDGVNELFRKLRRTHGPSVTTLTDWLIAVFPVHAFFSAGPMVNSSNSSQNVLEIGPDSSRLSLNQYFDKDHNKDIEFTNAWYSGSLELLAAEPENRGGEFFNNETNDRIKRNFFTVDMVMAKMLNETPTETMGGIKTMTLKELDEQLKAINWTQYLQAFLPEFAYKYVEKNGVSLIAIELMKKYEDYLESLDKQMLQDYLDFMLVRSQQESMPKRYRDLYERLMEEYFNITVVDRGSECYEEVKSVFSDQLSYLYVENYFNKSSIPEINQLIQTMKTTLIEMLSEEDWMNYLTRERAKNKAQNIKGIIAYDQQIYNTTSRLEKLQNLTFDNSTSYYDICYLIERWSLQSAWDEMVQPNVEEDIEFNAAVVNAYYYPPENVIILLAPILAPPFYNASLPAVLNYGSMGLVVAHELTHSLDNTGSKYDEEGNMVNWWDPRTTEQFDNKTECFVNQYGNITVVNGTNIRIDGRSTLGENLADNGGIKVAIRAMQKLLINEDFYIVGLEDYSMEQLFYMTYGFSWCENINDEGLKLQVIGDEHSPDKYRVNVVLSNQPQFAEAYNCPTGSKMNPVNKCHVW